MIGDGLIRHVQTGARIDHEQHDVGFVDGGQGLAGHHQIDAFLVTADAAGVDDGVGLAADLAGAVLAVTGQAGEIGDQSITGLGEAIE